MKVISHTQDQTPQGEKVFEVGIPGKFYYEIRVMARDKEEAIRKALYFYETDTDDHFMAKTVFERVDEDEFSVTELKILGEAG